MNKTSIPISVILLTRDSAEHIHSCLEALQAFEEVVVYDNGSKDATLAIVQEFDNVTLVQGPFIGFGPLRQLATQQARHDWIFAVDSDEVVSTELRDEIATLRLDTGYVYTVSRRNHFAGKPIRCCGWHPDFVIRLFNRKVTAYNDLPVHESVEVTVALQVEKLQNRLDHFPFEDVAALINKMQHYSSLYAQQHVGKRHASASLAMVKAFVAFLKNYILRGGFLDGAEGLLISVSNANGVFYKYMKLRESNQNNGC